MTQVRAVSPVAPAAVPPDVRPGWVRAGHNGAMRWAGRTLLAVVPVALGVVVGVFFILRIVPGDPAAVILGDQATTASIEALRQRLGLNLPLGRQLWDYVIGVFTRHTSIARLRVIVTSHAMGVPASGEKRPALFQTLTKAS